MPADSHRPIGHVVARHPLLPLETLDAFTVAVKQSPAAGRAFLAEVFTRLEVSEALYLASPGLMEGFDKWRAEPLSDRGRKVERALISYLQRMATRCTPFGLFASVSQGHVGKTMTTKVALASKANTRRRTRLDNGYMQALCEQISAKPSVRKGLRYLANETVHRVGERLHFVTARQDDGRRVYDLSAVDALEALTGHLLPAAKEGLTSAELAAVMVKAMPELTADEAAEFIDQLIDAQLLLGSLAVPLTGPEGLDAVLTQLKNLEGVEAEYAALTKAKAQLEVLDQTLGNSPAPYDALGETLAPLGVKLDKGKLVQVDLARLGDDTELPEALLRQCLRVGTLLADASPLGDDGLKAFRDAFSTRYEGNEVPLLEALDDEAGIGFTSESAGHAAPLLKDVLFENNSKAQEEYDPVWSRWVGNLLQRAQLDGNNEVVVTEQELEHRGRGGRPFPESTVMFLTLFARKPGTSDPVALFSAMGGPSSETLFGRFAFLDQRLEDAVRSGLRAEEALRPEAKFAELVHSPEGRSGNVIARPAVRPLEIPILSRGGLPLSQTVRLDDLMLSLRDGRFVLRSKALGCEIVPRLTNAHNTSLGLPLYRFLAALQHEGTERNGLWSWGAHRHAPSLPRVRAGNLVIVAARWQLGPEVLERFKDAAALKKVAAQLGWPRYLVAKEHDNTMAIDLENDFSIDTFIDSYAHRPQVTLEEDLDRRYGSPFTNEHGSFANELLVPMVATERRVRPLRSTPESSAARVFVPGGEWLYLRVHVTPAMAERVLTSVLPDVLGWAGASKALKRWFFIRYDEHGHHLRMRFQGERAWLREHLQPRLDAALEPWVQSHIVSRVLVDTYRREVERYGGDEAMLLAEAWFEAASEEALALIQGLPRDTDIEARSWAALVGVHRIHQLLLPTDELRIQAINGWRESLVAENGGGSVLETSLSKVGRTHRALVAKLMANELPEILAGVAEVLNAQTAILKPLAEGFRVLDEQKKLTTSLGSIGGALMHMQVNRLLRAQQRRQEMVMYDLLVRQMKSQQGRTRAR